MSAPPREEDAPAPVAAPAPDADRDVRAAGVFTLLTAASRGLGLVRSWLMARVLGGSLGADAFWAGFRLVNFFRLFLGEGALGHAMMPVLKELESRSPEEALRFAARCTRLAFVLCVLLMAALVAFVEPLLSLYVPDLPPEGRALTASLTREMSPYLVFIGVVSVLMTPLQAFRRFGPTAAHPLLFNLALILAALTARWFPTPARAFAWGVVGGGALQVALLVHASRRLGVPLFSTLGLGLSDPSLREVGRLTVPTLAGVALMRLNSVVDVRFASGLPVGSLACLQYGFLLYTAVLGIAAVGVATVYFTALSRSRTEGDDEGFRRALAEGGGLLLVVTVPAAVLGGAFPESLAGIFLGGRFGGTEHALTASAVRGYFAGLVVAGLFQLFSRALYAGKQQRLVVRSGALAAALNVYLDWLWVDPYGVGGLAAATSASLAVNAALLGFMLRRDLPIRALGASLLRSGGAAALAAASCAALVPEAWRGVPWLLLPLYGGIYGVGLGCVGSWEMRRLRAMLVGRLQRRVRRHREGQDP